MGSHPFAISNDRSISQTRVSGEVTPLSIEVFGVPPLWVADDAAAGVVVEDVAPKRLHCERSARKRDVLRRSLPVPRDPRAFVGILCAGAVVPPGARVLVGDRLGQLVPLDDGYPRGRAEPVEVR